MKYSIINFRYVRFCAVNIKLGQIMMNEKTKKLCIEAAFIVAVPICVMIIMCAMFASMGLYPFGSGTIAWCDMTQQVVPMTANLEDIISGKTGLFLNMQNAGGMSMIGVIFFFVASPLNLLAFCVPKQDLVLFMNVLTMIKLMAAGLTAMLFFRRCMKKLPALFAAALSVSYAFCGYAAVYYQNSIWLDVMYIFPLLMIGIYRIISKNSMWAYVAALSAMAVVNYYICYMVALFCILFFALICVRTKMGEYKQAGFLFISGSLLSLLITAVVWLPCLLQYFMSGRTTSVTQNLRTTSFIGEFQSVIPLLLYSAVAIVICIGCVIDKRERSRRSGTMLIMLVLLLIPMAVEPVNLMWHTGSYMSFPCRFAFMTVFVMLICSAQFLEDGSGHTDERAVKRSAFTKYGVPVICSLVFICAALLLNVVMRRNEDTIGKYSRALWSDDKYLGVEIKVFFIFAVSFGFVFMMFKKGLLAKRVFGVLLCCFVVAQSVSALRMYVAGSGEYDNERSVLTRNSFALEGKIDDDSFYRVKTTNKIFDVNNLGAMGYRSLAHYTSLTDRGYMYAMKKLGYSSYWMEVGSHGGTEFTDALFSVKYKITGTPLESESALAATNKFSVYRRENCIGLGLITDRDITDMDSFEGLDRFDVQQGLYRALFADGDGDELFTRYEPDSTGEVIINKYDDEILLTPFGKSNEIVYEIFVMGRQTLYFDCFDKLSSNLYETINGSFTVTVNNMVIQQDYPSQASNGLLKLGEYENCKVRIAVNVLKNVQCTSFGVYGLDMEKLEKTVESARSAQLDEKAGVITGKCEAQQGDKCVLFVPYSKTFNVQINGERVDYKKAFDDFIVFDLKQGSNDIRITAEPMGLTAGLVLSGIGAVLAAGLLIIRRKVKFDDAIYSVCRVVTIIAGALVIAVIYVYPIVLNCIEKKK